MFLEVTGRNCFPQARSLLCSWDGSVSPCSAGTAPAPLPQLIPCFVATPCVKSFLNVNAFRVDLLCPDKLMLKAPRESSGSMPPIRWSALCDLHPQCQRYSSAPSACTEHCSCLALLSPELPELLLGLPHKLLHAERNGSSKTWERENEGVLHHRYRRQPFLCS